MANLTAKPMPSGNDFLIKDYAAANAGSEGHHYQVFISLASALPHLSKGSHIGVIAALNRNPV